MNIYEQLPCMESTFICQGYKPKKPWWTHVGSKLCLLVPQVLGVCVSWCPSALIRPGLMVQKSSGAVGEAKQRFEAIQLCWHGIAFLLISLMNLTYLDICHMDFFFWCVFFNSFIQYGGQVNSFRHLCYYFVVLV